MSKKKKITPPSAVVVYDQNKEQERAGSPGTPIFGWDEIGRFVTGVRVQTLARRIRERGE